MKRRLVFLFVPMVIAVSVGASLAAANVAAPIGDVGSSRVTFFYRVGPSASCHGPGCAIGVVAAKAFRFDGSGAAYRATITLSLNYVTSPGGSFEIGVRVHEPDGDAIALSPAVRPLPAVDGAGSTTLAFLAKGLRPGEAYVVGIGANVTHRDGNHETSIYTSKVVVTVDASAS